MNTYNPDLAIGKLRVLPPRAKANGAASEPTEPLPYLDMSSWDANPAPEREWAVDNRIPMYQPHLAARIDARCRACIGQAVARDAR